MESYAALTHFSSYRNGVHLYKCRLMLPFVVLCNWSAMTQADWYNISPGRHISLCNQQGRRQGKTERGRNLGRREDRLFQVDTSFSCMGTICRPTQQHRVPPGMPGPYHIPKGHAPLGYSYWKEISNVKNFSLTRLVFHLYSITMHKLPKQPLKLKIRNSTA